jgi:hypothetical protein
MEEVRGSSPLSSTIQARFATVFGSRPTSPCTSQVSTASPTVYERWVGKTVVVIAQKRSQLVLGFCFGSRADCADSSLAVGVVAKRGSADPALTRFVPAEAAFAVATPRPLCAGP